MIRNYKKWVSIEDSDLMVTESEDVAVKAAETIIEEQQAKTAKEKAENEAIQEQQDAQIENIKAQAEDPFDPDKVEVADSTGTSEDPADSELEGDIADETTGATEDDSGVNDSDVDETTEDTLSEAEEDETEEDSDDKSEENSEDDSEEEDSESEEVESEDSINEAAAEEELEVDDVDLSTTEEEVEEAEDELEEAEEEGEEVEDEIIDDTKTLEDLEKESASVEEFIQLLKVAKESAHYEPLFMAQVDSKLNALHDMFGTHGPGIPSLETFNEPQYAELYYSTSLESFEGFKKRLNTIKKAVSLKLAESIRSLNTKMVDPAVKNLNTIIDGMLAKVNSEDSDYSVTFKVKLESDKDILKAYGDDTKTITAMINRISKQQLRVVDEAAKVLKSTTNAKFENIHKEAKTTLQIKNVDFKGLADGSLIGNNKTITKDPGKSNGTVMHEMAEHLVKSAIKVGTTEYDGDKSKKVTLNKADLVRLLSLCKMQIGLVTKAKKEVGEPAVAQSKLIAKDYIKLLDEQFYREYEKAETEEDFNILYIPHGIYSGLKIVNEHTILTYKFIVYHCLNNVSTITRRLKNTIK